MDPLPLLLAALKCTVDAGLELTWALHPTQVALGTSNAAFYVGVVVINSVRSADVVTGHFGTGPRTRQRD